MDESQTTGFKPPYLPFKTFLGLVEELRSKPLPPEIDRSLLRSKSGTDQANLLAALKGFGLISEAQAVEAPLRKLVDADEAQTKRALEAMLRANYINQFTLSEQNATEKALNDSFEDDFGVTGETRRKAVTFFLQAARFAGITLSPHFPVTRLGSGRTAGSRPRATVSRKPAIKPPAKAPATSTAEQITVVIGEAGSATLTVDVRWLELPDDIFTKLRQVTSDLRSLGVGGVEAGDSAADDSEADDAEEPF